jgi:hypothetical protein
MIGTVRRIENRPENFSALDPDISFPLNISAGNVAAKY